MLVPRQPSGLGQFPRTNRDEEILARIDDVMCREAMHEEAWPAPLPLKSSKIGCATSGWNRTSGCLI